MKCKECPAFGRDHISQLCVLRHNISKGYCNRTNENIDKELKVFMSTDSRAIHGHYILPRYNNND